MGRKVRALGVVSVEGLSGENVQLTTAVPLPKRMKGYLLDRASRLLNRHRHCFGAVLLHIYVKNANSRVGMTMNMFTDDGRFHAYVEDWDVRRAADDALNTIHAQIVKQFEKRAVSARELVHA